MQISSNFASLAVDRGLGKEVYGVAIQLHNNFSNGGKMLFETVDDMLQSYQTTFIA